jgi:hypothetical protein
MSECDYETVSTVYLGYDNAVTVVPYEDISERTYYDMSQATTVTVSADPSPNIAQGDAISATSDDAPTTVWWEQVGTTDEWRIHMKVGLFVGMVAGDYTLRIIITDAGHPNGLVLTDSVAVTVVDTP